MDERTLNDLLECSVCLERLDTTSKVLPCQHTFCRKCLEVSESHNCAFFTSEVNDSLNEKKHNNN